MDKNIVTDLWNKLQRYKVVVVSVTLLVLVTGFSREVFTLFSANAQPPVTWRVTKKTNPMTDAVEIQAESTLQSDYSGIQFELRFKCEDSFATLEVVSIGDSFRLEPDRSGESVFYGIRFGKDAPKTKRYASSNLKFSNQVILDFPSKNVLPKIMETMEQVDPRVGILLKAGGMDIMDLYAGTLEDLFLNDIIRLSLPFVHYETQVISLYPHEGGLETFFAECQSQGK